MTRCDDARDVGNIGVSKKIGKEYKAPLTHGAAELWHEEKKKHSGRSQSKKEIGGLDTPSLM